MSARDRFKDALRLSAETEGVHLRDAKEEMRPRSKREIEDVAHHQAQMRGYVGEHCASDRISEAVDRLLRYGTTVPPNELDLLILAEMDDAAIAEYAWRADFRDRLRTLRDEAWRGL